MKIRKKTIALILLVLVVAGIFLFLFLPNLTTARPLIGAQCGREATHRIKTGSWIIGLCDNCYEAAMG